MKLSFYLLLFGIMTLFPSLGREIKPLRLRGNGEKATPRAEAPPLGRVVLVHGFLNQGGCFKWMQQRLEQRGFICLAPNMCPNDGRGGLENLAEGLKREINDTFGAEEPISIIAFSMGGLISRHYLQHLGGAVRCKSLITISSPHQGTLAAWAYPSRGAEQMRPGSDFLTALNQSESQLGEMPTVSYRTPMDLIIVPPTSSIWQRADNLEFNVPLHPLMLQNKQVLDDIEQRLVLYHQR